MPHDFATEFIGLTGSAPFPWQQCLYEKHFSMGDFPAACSIPTGLGKTAVVAVWLLALAANPEAVPRRLVYAVSRRTVIDQATAEAERYRERLAALPELAGLEQRLRGLCIATSDVPLALSTLRGRLADDREWMEDPARPAVVVGTVDTVGSRLLFSGDGCGFESRPLLAGLLGQDTLLVYDEAHLEPAFEHLIRAVRNEQRGGTEFRSLQLMALTTDPRVCGDVIRLGEADLADALVGRRLRAAKALHLHPLKDATRPAVELAARALAFKDCGRAVLVFARSTVVVQQVAQLIAREKSLANRVAQLTGVLRGWERDRFATANQVFSRFLLPSDQTCEPRGGTVYLVCTESGEVGTNLSADHLVCDLTPFDSMTQRLGRVNRVGDCNDSEAHVLHPEWFDPRDPFDAACEQTLAILRTLGGDVSPATLFSLEHSEKAAASRPSPTILPTTDVLFDAWALTTARGRLPGRPPIAPYLLGVAAWESPESQVAWREEVTALAPMYRSNEERMARQAMDRKRLAVFAADLLGLYPLMPHEILRDTTARVVAQLAIIARRTPYLIAWLLHAEGSVSVHTIADLAEPDEITRLAGRTVILPPAAGGLSGGLLVGEAADSEACDVADLQLDPGGLPRRLRRQGSTPDPDPPPGMWLLRQYDFDPAADEEDREPPGPNNATRPRERYFRWYTAPAAPAPNSMRSPLPRPWPQHSNGVARAAARLAATLFPDRPDLQRVLTVAGLLHGLGKKRQVWQRSIGNHSSDTVYETSGREMRPVDLSAYRPEFGSLLDAPADPAFRALESPDERDLTLHLVAAQNGRGRPHFPADEAFDPERPAAAWIAAAREVPRRFSSVQRTCGRWGLAYLEALLWAAGSAARAERSVPPEGIT